MSRVVVFGGANLDLKARCRGPHQSGTSNLGVTHFSAGGVGRNIAHNLANLGIEVALVSAVGEDAAGTMLLDETARAGVDVSHVLKLPGRSGTYVAVLDERGELITAVNDMALLAHLTADKVRNSASVIAAADYVVADCNLPEEALAVLAAMAGDRLIVEPVSVPKAAKLARLQQQHDIFLATPNRDQFVALGGNLDPAFPLRRTGRIRNLVLHRGAEGATILSESGKQDVPAFPQTHIMDVTGAGDAAVAGLVFGLLKGYDLVRAARCGQAAASLKLASAESAAAGLTRKAILELIGER